MVKKMPDNVPEDIAEEIERKGGLKEILKDVPTQRELGKSAKMFKALSDPLRLKILCLLRVQDSCVCLIRSVANIAYSKLSYHLSILKNAGLIEGERRGNYIIYRLTDLGKKVAGEVCKK